MIRDKEVIIEIAKAKAKEHQIPLELVLAVIETESNFNNMTYRFEPNWKYHLSIEAFSKMTLVSYNTEKAMQQISWGLMQVMGTVARELGFKGLFTELCDPGTGIDYGCAKLAGLLEKYSSRDDAIASYNAGSPRRQADGTYFNQDYVTKVNNRMLQYMKQIKGE